MARKKKQDFCFAFGNALLGIAGIVHSREVKARAAERAAQDALDRLHVAEARVKLIEQQTRLVEQRVEQTPEQTEGIIRRYLMTTENTENAIIRQQKQQVEILRLKLLVKELEQRLGITTPETEFHPENWEE